ncbi:MAG: glycosyltransferase [Phycisphaerales bacterium]
MRVSFIIPAHDEERLIARTVMNLRSAAAEAALDAELIVVDDASSDQTGELAAAAGAIVVRHERRQIAATRNLGARTATGELLIFVDADTWPNAMALRQAVAAMAAGAVGGGAPMRFEGRVPLCGRVLTRLFNAIFRLKGRSGGAFFFCTREALQRAGGWDETKFAAEELYLAMALKQFGRFVVIRERVLTSGRKLRSHSAKELLGVFFKVAADPTLLHSRESLDMWYGPRRRDDPDHQFK